MIKSKERASNTLLYSAEYAIRKKEHFSFLKHLARTQQRWRTQILPLQQQNQCALQLRGPSQAPRCLSLSYFSLEREMSRKDFYCPSELSTQGLKKELVSLMIRPTVSPLLCTLYSLNGEPAVVLSCGSFISMLHIFSCPRRKVQYETRAQILSPLRGVKSTRAWGVAYAT